MGENKTRPGPLQEKDAFCKSCKATYRAREEKESDVNIATHLVSDAYEDLFDQAFLVTNDSDLVGPLRFLRARFPKKKVKIIVPLFADIAKNCGASRLMPLLFNNNTWRNASYLRKQQTPKER
jgi:hypothetical protein